MLFGFGVTSINRSGFFLSRFYVTYVADSLRRRAACFCGWASDRSCSSTTAMERKNATLLNAVVSIIPGREWRPDASSRMLRINRLIILQGGTEPKSSARVEETEAYTTVILWVYQLVTEHRGLGKGTYRQANVLWSAVRLLVFGHQVDQIPAIQGRLHIAYLDELHGVWVVYKPYHKFKHGQSPGSSRH